METPIWSAVLDHVCLETSSPQTMRSFYRDVLGMQETELGRNSWLLEGPERRLVLTKGMSKKFTSSSFKVADDDKMMLLRKHIEAEGYTIIEKSVALFQQRAFELTDPDGNIICFGVGTSVSKKLKGVGGRLQHVVVASACLDLMVDFYGRVLGFLPSDYVMKEDGKIVAAFYRSNPEHHSLAVFAAAEKAFDHIAFETPSWNHLRDWADRLAAFDIPIW
jgi:catechol 2,3-dioxygenase-like lactoylglutathione lyase family enzyme